MAEKVTKEGTKDSQSISKLTIAELNEYYNATLNIMNYYARQYEMSKREADAKARLKYINYYIKIQDEIEKRIAKLCE